MLQSLYSELNIPTEVLRRFGGITSREKRKLFMEYQSLGFVTIPGYLQPRITTVESLDHYGVCRSAKSTVGDKAQYFLCPNFLTGGVGQTSGDARYCCSSASNQYCCTLAEFASGIRLLSPVLTVSPSIAIGSLLGALLIATLVIIVVFARLSKRDRKLSRNLRSRSLLLQNPIQYETRSSGSSSRIPPSKRLISSQVIPPAASVLQSEMKPKDSTVPYQTHSHVPSEADEDKGPPNKRLLSATKPGSNVTVSGRRNARPMGRRGR